MCKTVKLSELPEDTMVFQPDETVQSAGELKDSILNGQKPREEASNTTSLRRPTMCQCAAACTDYVSDGGVRMSKTKSEWILRHYPPLRNISMEEWDRVFDRQPYAWSVEEDSYVSEWYGRDATIDIAFALGRCPWSVQRRARKLINGLGK